MTANKLDEVAFTKLGNEPHFNLAVDSYIMEMIKHYSSPPNKEVHTIGSCLMAARGDFLSNVGKFYKDTGTKLNTMIQQMKVRGALNVTSATLAMLKIEQHPKFGGVEKKFRKILVDKEAFAEDDLPKPK